jgi:hypothetical protein
MTLFDKVVVPAEVMARQIGEETVILDLKSGAYFGLEAAGSRIWQLLAAGTTLAEVCETVEGEYDVAHEALERDVLELAEQLQREGLLTTTSAEGSVA